MAGLYIHIPFCRSKCAYCDFFSIPVNSVLKKDTDCFAKYIVAIQQEMAIRISEIKEPIYTIYVGGGTPTAIPLPLLSEFLSSIHRYVIRYNKGYGGEDISEFTVEANPEDISRSLIDTLRNSGVDRISIGIQSFDTCQLNAIMRRHDSTSSRNALTILTESGINYSADLIYGLPGQSVDSWSYQLDSLLDFEPPHFSAYLLSYEPGTRLYARKERGLVTEADEQTACRMYDALMEAAAARGYNHYEISNFSKPGLEARHNSSYWNLTPYLGLGCSAHSFDGEIRRINPCNLGVYMEALLKKIPETAFQEEPETTINKVNDYIITSLRTSSGLSRSLLKSKWSRETASLVEANLSHLRATGHIVLNGEANYRIPEKYWLTSDSILRDIILE